MVLLAFCPTNPRDGAEGGGKGLALVVHHPDDESSSFGRPQYRITFPHQGMVDKIVAVRRDKCGAVIGYLGEAELIALNRMLAPVVGIAD